ncbi:hypothetical protein [Dechloromonas denitrificans]|nr:hypothetical protein [Dechloromonas denitrificans]
MRRRSRKTTLLAAIAAGLLAAGIALATGAELYLTLGFVIACVAVIVWVY